MKLNKKSRLVRWAYWLDRNRTVGYRLDDGRIMSYDQLHYEAAQGNYFFTSTIRSNIPTSTTLCRFFWRAFVAVPLITPPALVIIGILSLVGAIGRLFFAISIPWTYRPIFLGKAADKIVESIERTVDAVRYSTFVAGLKALKGRVCPLITFVDGE